MTLFMERINLVGFIVCKQGRGEDESSCGENNLFVIWSMRLMCSVY